MVNGHRKTSDNGRKVALLAQRYVVAVGGLLYGLTLGMRRSRHRGLVADVARHFGFSGNLSGMLPVAAYNAVTSPSTPVVLPAVLGQSGNVTEAELIAIARIVAARKPRTALEIGTFDGRTTLTIAANAPEAEVVTLDLPPHAAAALSIDTRDAAFIDKPASGALFAGSPQEKRIRQVYGDSATYDFGGLEVDFAFIDGSHSYEYAMSDSRRVRKLLRNGRGVIIWHDYGTEWDGVTRALNELSREPEFRQLVAIQGTTLAMLDVG